VTAPVQVGILILSYHQPRVTLACVRRLLEVEGDQTRILWLENDADTSSEAVLDVLKGSGLPWVTLDAASSALPEAGQIGYLPIGPNLGYAGGNNVGLRFLHRCGVPHTWIMNNDTRLERGDSRDLVQAAEARPEVGLWGMRIVHDDGHWYLGCRVQTRDFASAPLQEAASVENDPMGYISGCAMFFRTQVGMAAGGIPEDYFLYYEDLAFSWEIRGLGLGLGVVDTVAVHHAESLSTGRRSDLVEFYNRRNRWRFIQRYFPERLRDQERRFFTYQLQKLIFRLRFDRIRLEWLAWRDFKAGRLQRTRRRW
jgi:GT2 family glycosyltransferase